LNFRLTLTLVTGLSVLAGNANAQCSMNEIEKSNTRLGICRQQIGIASGYGCTSLLMRAQVADQFQQIELARRCGFNAEADKLEKFYQQTTPLIVSFYECVDTSVDRVKIEQEAKEEVAKALAVLPAGCSADLKAKMEARLPKVLALDEKSWEQVNRIAGQIGLKPASK
jgi:hypothetical protein